MGDSIEPVRKKLKYGESDPERLEKVKEMLKASTEVQKEIDKINEELTNEIMKVEQKYTRQKRPLYNKRSESLHKIPKFWQIAIQNHPILTHVVMDLDAEILGHVTELDVEDFEDIKKGFKITMKFSENEFFENSELVKSITFDLDTGTAQTTCTEVKWKEGKEMDVIADDKSNFFVWFVTSETLDDANDEVADQVRESLWPDAVRYFTGELAEDDHEDLGDEYGGFFGGDDYDEEEDDDYEEGGDEEGEGEGEEEDDEEEEEEGDGEEEDEEGDGEEEGDDE
eukprot:CAMPEP_0117670112 /NCGR_PEP_ID=MMETSP0804-20121206/12553_1 /TAXON_ID=1074897 /ORGANISM="Tetraselmis astigmatica, Strain CCMP880" /LENGTH=282 /DNA_ID=CAMNT_0005478337 /DNA_START=66 /DNA_END=914 /DNA_ORIENTATION=-